MNVSARRQRVLIIGGGEVGGALFAHLHAAGDPVAVVDPSPPASLRGEVYAHVADAPGPFGVVLAAVPSGAATAVVQGMEGHLGEATYVDLSSSPRATMTAAADLLPPGRFVDGAIMGSVAADGARAPMLLAGQRAQQVQEWMSTRGLNAAVVPDGKPGDAGTIKLLRSIITKGLEAVAVEGYLAAREAGLLDALRANLQDVSRTPFPDFLDAMVKTHVGHAPRRAREVDAAIEQAQALGLSPIVAKAVAERFRRTEAGTGRAVQDSTEGALAWLRENAS